MYCGCLNLWLSSQTGSAAAQGRLHAEGSKSSGVGCLGVLNAVGTCGVVWAFSNVFVLAVTQLVVCTARGSQATIPIIVFLLMWLLSCAVSPGHLCVSPGFRAGLWRARVALRACRACRACLQCWNDLLALACLWAAARTGQWLYYRAEHASHIPTDKTRAAWHGGFDDAVRYFIMFSCFERSCCLVCLCVCVLGCVHVCVRLFLFV
jgi:hypothetical protein